MKRCIASEAIRRRGDQFDRYRKMSPLLARASNHGRGWRKERPIIVIECMPECSLNEANVRAWPEPRLVKCQFPDRIIFADVPLTAIGKLKKALRTSCKYRLMA